MKKLSGNRPTAVIDPVRRGEEFRRPWEQLTGPPYMVQKVRATVLLRVKSKTQKRGISSPYCVHMYEGPLRRTVQRRGSNPFPITYPYNIKKMVYPFEKRVMV